MENNFYLKIDFNVFQESLRIEVGYPKNTVISEKIAIAIKNLISVLNEVNYRLDSFSLKHGGHKVAILEDEVVEKEVRDQLADAYLKFMGVMEEEGYSQVSQPWIGNWHFITRDGEEFLNLRCNCLFLTPKESINL